jgi:hypothetical protein
MHQKVIATLLFVKMALLSGWLICAWRTSNSLDERMSPLDSPVKNFPGLGDPRLAFEHRRIGAAPEAVKNRIGW